MTLLTYQAGRTFASRFDLVRRTNGYWTAFRGGEEIHLIEPVTVAFLQGVKDGGCPVIGLPERRKSGIASLMERVAFVMGKAV